MAVALPFGRSAVILRDTFAPTCRWTGLSRPEQVVYFFRQVLGLAVVSKEALRQRTIDYQNWVEAFARNHQLPIEWAEKGVRKEEYVLPWLRRMRKRDAYGAYFIFKSMEQGPTFRISVPKYPSRDPNHRILAHQRSRFTHYCFYIRDEVLGPFVMCVGSLLPFQTTYYLNGHSFIERELVRLKIPFRKDDNAFLAVAAALTWLFLRHPRRLTLGALVAATAVPFIGIFGLFHGGWSHAAMLAAFHAGATREVLARVFGSPDFAWPDDVAFEATEKIKVIAKAASTDRSYRYISSTRWPKPHFRSGPPFTTSTFALEHASKTFMRIRREEEIRQGP